MLYAHGPFPTRLIIQPDDSFTLLEAAGYAKQISPGCIAMLPLGVLALNRISGAIQNACHRHGFWEIGMPLLQQLTLWQESGRWEKYPGLFCETTIGGDKRFVINPTEEEAIIDAFRSAAFTDDDLPLRLFQISERVRNEIRPAFGFVRSRCFLLADLYAIAQNADQCEEEALRIESVVSDVIAWTGLPVQHGLYLPSTLGVPVYSYWVPSVSKQCLVTVCASCGSSFRVRDKMLRCPTCTDQSFHQVEAAEIGDVTRNGNILTTAMSARTTNGREPVYVAMAGIGVSRLLQLLAEKYHDADGLAWPIRMAPFQFHLISNQARIEEAGALYEQLQSLGYDVLFDTRPFGIGRLLIDADLLGLPVRVVFGKKTVAGTFEVTIRRTKQTTTIVASPAALLEHFQTVRNQEDQG